MTDTSTTQAKTSAKTARAKMKSATGGAAFPDFEAFAVPNMEVPAAFREVTEKSIENARDTYAKVKSAAEDATDLMEDTFETSRQGAVEFNHKAVDAFRANADATFSFIKDIMSAKTLSEAIELQSTFARKQFDALSTQTREMQELATKLGTDVSAPVKEAMEKSFKDLKVN
ncbi:phasin [Roseibium salinum]|uniref:Phasin n=1 Tax=Roseibium salinum TaxID=1604349 RepID=A0ABT3R497_9HYPH|nr:phasin [Roseibium sp. DSM 29163]MCX2724038.1 phasin [Roseibium sp. DSM 29163]